MLASLNLAADIFADTTDTNAILREAGLPAPERTQEEMDEAERSAVIAESYRDIATVLKDEAMKVIAGATRRT